MVLDEEPFYELPHEEPLHEHQQWWEPYIDCTLDDVLQQNFDPTERKLPVIILQVRKNNNKLLSTYQSRDSGKTKTSQYAPFHSSYDRLFLFGYRNSPNGRCFAIIRNSSATSKKLCATFTSDSTIVGATGYLLEPRYCNRNLTQDSNLPLLEVEEPFIQHQVLQHLSIPLQVDSMAPGETFFFQLVGVKLTLQTPYMCNSDCGGSQCDRLFLPATANQCGCFSIKTSSIITLQGMAIVKDNNNNELLKVNHRSWTFTKLCVAVTTDATLNSYKQQNLRPLRHHIRDLIQYVNNNDGWNICGWARRGAVHDVSDLKDGVKTRISEDIAAEDVSPHIVSIVPYRNTEEFLNVLGNMKHVVH